MSPSTSNRMSYVARILVSGVLLGAIGWLHISLFDEWRVVGALEREGVTASAAVTSGMESSGSFRNHARLIRYQFDIGASTFSSSEIVWDGAGTTVNRVSIRYLESDPRTSRLSNSDRLTTLLWAACLLDLFLALAAFAIWRELRTSSAAGNSKPDAAN